MAKLEAQAANANRERKDGVAKLDIGMPKYESYGLLSLRDG